METLKSCPFEEPVGEYEIENDKPMQTNEEWFCGLSTEEKGKWITENLSVYADDWAKSDEKLLNPATWVDWLKEIHE